MNDQFSSDKVGLNSPANNGFAITPSDSVDLSPIPRCIDIGTGGTLVVVLVGDPVGSPITLKNRPSGSVYSYRVRRVLATGTTAADLNGMY